MRVTCPACQAEMGLDVLLAHEEARHALARLAAISLPFGALVLRYIALFRPAKRRLSIERMTSLIEELAPDVERRAINRKGRDWDAPIEAWRAAIETVLAARDKGTLTTPLTSHGYLYEVIAGLADKAEAQAESTRESERRTRREAGPAAEAAPVAVALSQVTHAHQVVQSMGKPAGYDKPSRMVREMLAKVKKQPTEGGAA